MAVAKRRFTTWERLHLFSGTMIQLAVRVADPSIVPCLVDEALKMSVGLHTCRVGDEIWKTQDPPVVHRLPSWIKNVEDACEWTARQGLPSSVRCSNLAVGRDIVVLNSNHMAADGGFFKQVLQRYQQSLDGIPAQKYPQFLEATDTHYADEINKPDTGRPYNQGSCTLLKCVDKVGVADDAPTHAWTFRVPTRELRCFDPRKGRVTGLTEAIWTSFILSASAFNGKLGVMKCGTCCDLRGGHKYNPELACDFTIVAPEANCSPRETVGEMGRKMRESLRKLLNSQQRFAFLRPDLYNYPRVDSGCGLEISHLGPLTFKHPIVDACMNILMENKQTEDCVSLLSFCKVNEESDVFQARLRCPPTRLDPCEARIIGKTVEHALRTIDPAMSIKDAFESLATFQKSL